MPILESIFLGAAIVSWLLGAAHAKVTDPPLDWLCLGLAFAGFGLWFASQIH